MSPPTQHINSLMTLMTDQASGSWSHNCVSLLNIYAGEYIIKCLQVQQKQPLQNFGQHMAESLKLSRESQEEQFLRAFCEWFTRVFFLRMAVCALLGTFYRKSVGRTLQTKRRAFPAVGAGRTQRALGSESNTYSQKSNSQPHSICYLSAAKFLVTYNFWIFQKPMKLI